MAWFGSPLGVLRPANERFSEFERWDLSEQPEIPVDGTLLWMNPDGYPMEPKEMIELFGTRLRSPIGCHLSDDWEDKMDSGVQYVDFYKNLTRTWAIDMNSENLQVGIRSPVEGFIPVSTSLEEFLLRVDVENTLWYSINCGQLCGDEVKWYVDEMKKIKH